MQTAHAQAFGDWLVEYQWTHFVTLTVSPRGGKWDVGRAGRCLRSKPGVLRAFKGEFHRQCTKVAGGPVPYIVSVEGGLFGDNPHVHALLYGTEMIAPERLQSAWRHGRATVEVYDPTKAAAYYVAKEAAQDDFTLEMSKTLPPRRAHD